jgi:hypothetical protein
MKKCILWKIFFCLFCNFCGSKPTRTRTQNREKQRSGLILYISKDKTFTFCKPQYTRRGIEINYEQETWMGGNKTDNYK